MSPCSRGEWSGPRLRSGPVDVYLETARMVLRRFTAADVELLVELDSDPEVMRWLSGGIPTAREVVEREILPGFLRHYERDDQFGHWAAIERATGEFLGWFSLRRRDWGAEDEAELGYRLRRAAWGRGLATEGARAVIVKGFAALGLERIVATTYEENARSREVVERVGMTIVRSYRMTPEQLAAQDSYDPTTSGDPWPGEDVEYAITREQWLKSQ